MRASLSPLPPTQEGPAAASKSQCTAGFSQPVGPGSLRGMRQEQPHLQNGAKGQGHKRKRWGCARPSPRLGGGLVPTLHRLILRVPCSSKGVVFAKTDSHLGPQLLPGGKILGARLCWWRQEGVRRNLRSRRRGVHGRIGKWRHRAR